MTTQAQHTPGPWKFEEFSGGEKQAEEVRQVLGREPTRMLTNEGYAFVSTDGGVVATIAPQRQDLKKRDLCTEEDQERSANARLIAAAPDLLAACDAGLDALARHINEADGKPVCLHVRQAYNILDAALAKARGEGLRRAAGRLGGRRP